MTTNSNAALNYNIEYNLLLPYVYIENDHFTSIENDVEHAYISQIKVCMYMSLIISQHPKGRKSGTSDKNTYIFKVALHECESNIISRSTRILREDSLLVARRETLCLITTATVPQN